MSDQSDRKLHYDYRPDLWLQASIKNVYDQIGPPMFYGCLAEFVGSIEDRSIEECGILAVLHAHLDETKEFYSRKENQ